MNKQKSIKVIWSMLFIAELLLGMDVPIDEVEKQLFKNEISVNSKIVQLSSAKEQVMARMGGKISTYLVKQGQSVKKGQAIAKIDSLELSGLFSELKLLRKQLLVHQKNYNIVRKLYNAGLESMQNLNQEQREKDETASKIESIKAQLSLMGVSSKTYKSSYTVYAQGSGTVEKILIPTNAVVDANTPLVSIVKGGESFLAKAYVPLKYVNEVRVGQEGELLYGAKRYKMHTTQILPQLDEKTQQMVILLALDEPVPNLFVNAYVETKLSIGTPREYLAVKKSALSFFNNEWVVFVPKHHEEHEEEHGKKHKEEKHDEHAGHDHGEEKHEEEKHDEYEGHDHGEEKHEEEKHDEHAGHDHGEEKHEEEKHDEHEGHDEHEEDEIPYDIAVVKIIKQNEHWVAIEGIDEHRDYVSAKSYYIKSLLLKSSLGGHGH